MKEGMRMKKLAIMALSVVLISVMAIGGSLAYFTDTVTNANNVITAGSVHIEQIELQRKAGVAYNGKADDGYLVPFVDRQAMYPAHTGDANAYSISTTDLFQWGNYVSADNAANGLWNDAALSGVIDKFVFVKNIGASQAYCRTLIALECPDDVTYGTTYSTDVDIMLNLNSTGIQWTGLNENEALFVNIDGTRYQVLVATYTDTVKAGETSMPSLLQVVMTDNATNREALAMGEDYKILVLTQACQTTTFIDADDTTLAGKDRATYALDTCFAAVDTAAAADWFYNMLHPTAATANTQANTAQSQQSL